MSIWLEADSEEKVKVCSGIGKTSAEYTISSDDLLNARWPDEIKRLTERKAQEAHIHAVGKNYWLIVASSFFTKESGISETILHRPPSGEKPKAPPFPAGSREFKYLARGIGQGMPRSLGGPRPLTGVDIRTMTPGIASCFTYYDEAHLDAIPSISKHPAWPAITFRPHHHKPSGISLISLIGDPRWYVDPERPDSTKGLIEAFGLGRDGEDNLKKVLNGTAPDTGVAQVVVRAGFGGREITMDSDKLLTEARSFLRMVCSVWLDNLTAPRTYKVHAVTTGSLERPVMEASKKYSPQLFNPKYEFESNKVRHAWDVHINSWLEDSK
jgi:hypothetical protein